MKISPSNNSLGTEQQEEANARLYPRHRARCESRSSEASSSRTASADLPPEPCCKGPLRLKIKAIDPKPVLSWTSGQPTTSGPSINPPWEWGSVTLGIDTLHTPQWTSGAPWQSTGPRDFGGPSEVATLRPTDHRAAGLPASEEAPNYTLQADPGCGQVSSFRCCLTGCPGDHVHRDITHWLPALGVPGRGYPTLTPRKPIPERFPAAGVVLIYC